MSLLLGWEHEIIRGVVMTLIIAVVSLVFGLILGVMVASAKLSRLRVNRFLANGFTTIVRGTPELLIVFFAYFGGTKLASVVVNLFHSTPVYVEVPSLIASIFALSIIFAGYAAESIRGAMQALPKGQLEAAEAFAMTPLVCFLSIKLPLIWRYALPALGNNWLSLLKSTSLISLLGLEELMRVSYIATTQTAEPFRFYITAAIIYLLLTVINVFILEFLERRSRRGEKVFSQ